MIGGQAVCAYYFISLVTQALLYINIILEGKGEKVNLHLCQKSYDRLDPKALTLRGLHDATP